MGKATGTSIYFLLFYANSIAIYNRFKKQLSPEEAKVKAQKWCAYRDRCISEMEMKLSEWGLNQEEMDKLVDELVESDFINEKRFIRSFARGKFMNNKWGKQKIRMAMREKKLKDEDIEEGLAKLDEKEYEKTARHLTQRKWDELSRLEPRARNSKVYYHMISKGFEPQAFLPLLKELSGQA